MDKVSMSYLFSFPRYQTKCVINLFLMTSQTLRFILDQPLKQWWGKRGKDRNTRIWISWEWKGLSLGEKLKIWWKIVDTNFKQYMA